MDVHAIEQGLANAADNISGLRAFTSLPDSIEPPSFAPTELEIEYNQTFGGLVVILFTCGVFTSRGYSDVGRKLLNSYTAESGSSSVKAALESDKTLGGVAKTLRVERVRNAYRLYNIGGTDYLGAQFDVRLWA